MDIHPSAVISPRAELDSGVKIGPYSIVGDRVKIGRDTVLDSNVVLDGNTEIGKENRIYSFVSLGTAPQDVGYRGEDTRLTIGSGNVIREFVTINRATTKEEWKTTVGDRNYIMAYAHIAHDSLIGNDVIMANAATLGGHVEIGDHAVLGGLVAVHQFVRIGSHAFIGGHTAVAQDIPPFMLTSGHRARLFGINRKGLERAGLSPKTIEGLKKAYRIIWRDKGKLSQALEKVRAEVPPSPELDLLLKFFHGSKRGVVR